MLIDPLAIKFSPKRTYATYKADQQTFIEGWKTTLNKAGWSVKQALKATGQIDYPLGYPIVDGGTVTPKTVVGCSTFISIGNQQYTIYDPGRQQPPPNPACIFVPLGVTATAGLSTLTSIITAQGFFNATYENVGGSHFIVHLEAIIGGAIGNGVNILGDGRFGVGSGLTTGGGYNLESGSGASIYQCQLTSEDTFPGSLQFIFTMNGTPATYLLQGSNEPNSGPSIDSYTIAANRYGFALFDGPQSVTGAPYRSCVLFAMAPYIPPATDPDIPNGETFAPAYAVFALGKFRDSTIWYQGVTTCLDSYAFTYDNTGGWPRLLAMRSAGQALLTPTLKPLVTCAYVMFGKDQNSGAAVVGKMWDCAVVHDFVEDVIIAGQRFIRISSQQSSGSTLTTSLVMCVPPPEPIKSGTVSTVNNPPGKASVFWGGGDDFSGLMAGDSITINGIPNVIDSVTDSLALICANPIIPPLISVDYTVP